MSLQMSDVLIKYMREIKFRAWRLNKDRHTGISVEPFMEYNINDISRDLILMQYTGLKDKNGKEIYEGDILKVMVTNNIIPDQEQKGMIFSVVYQDHGFIFNPKMPFNHSYSSSWTLHEVIGNIHENPQLIKQ